MNIPVPVCAEEIGLARQVRMSRLASVRSFSTPRPNLVLTHGFLLFFPFSATTVLMHTANRQRASPEFIGPRNCVPHGVHRQISTRIDPVFFKLL